jgi:hypothetical protein
MRWVGFGNARRKTLAMAVTAILVELACGAPARSEDPSPQGNPGAASRGAENLNAIPLPGWIADNSDAWTKDRAAYQESCATTEVRKEIEYLDKLNAYDHAFLKTTQSYVGEGATKRESLEMTGKLRNDIAMFDILSARLQALPPCVDAAASSAKAPVAETDAPVNATPSTAVAPENSKAPTAEGESGRLVINFDNRLAALTPSGIRAVNEAVARDRKGESVQITIEGCTAEAAKSSGSVCGRRLMSLKDILLDRGVRNPKRLLADYQ